MDEMEWMIAKQSLGEELELERTVRSVAAMNDLAGVRELCISLIRQNWHQRKLLGQAVTRIAEMDAQSISSS
tara:strand:+ start:758 stop:973 length:216 start_codon:yes stop_codon:yes gene_type:complete